MMDLGYPETSRYLIDVETQFRADGKHEFILSDTKVKHAQTCAKNRRKRKAKKKSKQKR